MHLNEEPKPIDWTDRVVTPTHRALEKVAHQALSKNPNNRHQTALEFAEDLRACLAFTDIDSDNRERLDENRYDAHEAPAFVRRVYSSSFSRSFSLSLPFAGPDSMSRRKSHPSTSRIKLRRKTRLLAPNSPNRQRPMTRRLLTSPQPMLASAELSAEALREKVKAEETQSRGGPPTRASAPKSAEASKRLKKYSEIDSLSEGFGQESENETKPRWGTRHPLFNAWR